VGESDGVFKALSDPTRREIIKLLRRGPLSSGDIARKFPVAWATISRHLAVLKDADIITAEKNGNSVQYELNATVLQELVEIIYDWTRKGGKRA
jgi:ArsR family transcriptional regulator, arsenate/arsenite/antimonite-responsive transcriptional repressor